jgi:hypothetical protein
VALIRYEKSVIENKPVRNSSAPAKALGGYQSQNDMFFCEFSLPLRRHKEKLKVAEKREHQFFFMWQSMRV